MSTFTRLYFVNRGPGIAEQDGFDNYHAADDRIGSPGLAPAGFADDPRASRDTDDDAEYYHPLAAAKSGVEWHSDFPTGPARARQMRGDFGPDEDMDLRD